MLPGFDGLRSTFHPSRSVTRCLALWVDRFPGQSQIASIVRDMSIFAQWVEDESAKDPAFYHRSDLSGAWVVPLIHRCLQLIPVDTATGEQPASSMQESLRHACILFVQNFRRKFGIVIANVDDRVARLRVALTACMDHWAGIEDMLRWVVVTGGLEANPNDQAWFASVLATRPGLQENDVGLIQATKRFIWFRDIPRTRVANLLSLVSSSDTRV